MSDKTGIEWADATWNPVTGCSKVSAGCKHCYAERDWARLSAPRPTPNLYTGREFTDVQCHPEKLDQPLRWTKPRRIFVNSMSDLFHPDVPSDFIQAVFSIMAKCPHHTFQVLTKRPDRMQALLTDWERRLTFPSNPRTAVLPNVWLGVSIEDQDTADKRIPMLLGTPAAVRFLSVEPLLGPVDLTRICIENHATLGTFANVLLGHQWDESAYDGGGQPLESDPPNTARIDWVIVGGESGPKARPMHPDWVRSLRDQCEERGIPFLFKQWGEYLPGLDSSNEQIDAARTGVWVRQSGGFHDGNNADAFRDGDAHVLRVGKKSAGLLLDGVQHDGYPGARS